MPQPLFDSITTVRAALLALGLMLWASVSSAQTPSIVLRRPALHWVRSEEAMSCVDPRTLAEHVESLVGPVLVRPSEAEHSIEGRAEVRTPGRVHVRVRVLDALGNKVGEREFEEAVEQCDKITPAIVFVIGMAIDPEVAAHGLPPSLLALLGGSDKPAEQALLAELDDLPGGEAPPEPPPQVQIVAAPAPVSPARWQGGALLRAALHEAPRALLSVEARLLHDFGSYFAAGPYLRGGGQLGPHSIVGASAARLAVLDVGGLACLADPASRRLRLHGCVGAELSTRIGRGDGFGENWVSTRVGAGLVGQLTARLSLTPSWGVMVLLNGRIGLIQRGFSYDDRTGRHQGFSFPRFAGALALGPTYEF